MYFLQKILHKICIGFKMVVNERVIIYGKEKN